MGPSFSGAGDRKYLGVLWGDKLYVDGMLLRSAPKIFTAVADALEWYLDDYIVIGSPGSDQCKRDQDTLERVCDMLGVPLWVDRY